MSPEVWNECRAIIETTATDLGLSLELPNEDFTTPEPPSAWVSVDIGGDAAQTLELGNQSWIENGAVWIHTMLPLGTGIANGLGWRKQFSIAFRAAEPTIPGLYWREHSFDPLGSDDGVWRRLSLIVRYEYDDRLVAGEIARAVMGGASAMDAAAE